MAVAESSQTLSRARLEETITRSFRLDGDGLRDIDALLHEHGDEVGYAVIRRDSLEFETSDVEVVLKEINGKTAGIKSLAASLKSPNLEVKVQFDEGVKLRAESTDRAHLLLIVADLKALIRDRLQGRSSSPRSRIIRLMTPVVLWWIVSVGYMVADVIHESAQRANHDRAVQAYEKKSEAAHERQAARERADIEKVSRQAKDALAAGRDAQIEFLVTRYVHSAAAVQGSSEELQYPDQADDPWFFDSPLVFLLLGPAVAAAGALGVRWLMPDAERIFLWGAQIELQLKRDRVREKLLWGLGVALVVGVLASFIAAPLT